MGRGRKRLLGALRRGGTSARADSPARTRFARVRRPTQRGLLVTAHGELRPVALISLSPAMAPMAALVLVPQPPHAPRHRPPCARSHSPLPIVLGDVPWASSGGAHAISATISIQPDTPFCTPWESPSPITSPPVHGAVSFLADDAAGNVRGPGSERPHCPRSPRPCFPVTSRRHPRHPPRAPRDARHAQRWSHTPLAASGKQQNAVCGARPPAAPSQAARPEPRPIPVRPPIIVAPCTLNLVHTHVPRARRAEREPSNSAAACDAGGQSPRFFAAHPPPVPAAPRPLSPLLVSASFARSRRPFWQRIACPSSC